MIFDPRPESRPLGGQTVKIQLGQNMVMLHIKLKGIIKCSSMAANILSADPSLTHCWGQKFKSSTFSEHGHVAYQIKGNHQIQQHGNNYFARRPLPNLGDGVNRLKFNFFSTWPCAYQIKENHQMQRHGSNNFARRPVPDPADGIKTS